MAISSDFLELVKEKLLVDTRWKKTVGLLGIEEAKKGGDNECV